MKVSARSNDVDRLGIYADLASLLTVRHWANDLKLFSRQAARSMLLGETRSRFRGRGMEFEEVRAYQAGDDIRSIDWRVSARTGGTYTKLFCEEHERPVHVIVDQRNSLFFGSTTQFKSVLAAEVACAIGWAALAGSDRIGGQIIGEFEERDIRAKRNKQAVLKFIHDLIELNSSLPVAPIENQKANSIANTLEECRRITRPGTAIFIISDFHDINDNAAKALSNLGRHSDVTLIQIIDPLEQQLPSGRVSISNGTERIAVSLNENLKSNYQTRLEDRQQQLQQAALRARAYFTQLTTEQSARHSLTRIFAK
ncbi:MAG: DUF58 domain-containing protein [Acidiferrobacterales bacterium]|nr:DUF58 domain-containing protein [Acidiferrobacterales bacterium]